MVRLSRQAMLTCVALTSLNLLPPAPAHGQGHAAADPCVICSPMIRLEPAAFARNLARDAGHVDFLARVHVMAPTGVPRLGISLATQWVVPSGDDPMVMPHLTYRLLRGTIEVSPLVGMMNMTMGGERVWEPMTALYVTAPSGVPGSRLYALGTLIAADDVVPSLGLGLSVPLAPLP